MVDHSADADPFTKLVIMVAGHVRQHAFAAGQTQGVKKFGATKGLGESGEGFGMLSA